MTRHRRARPIYTAVACNPTPRAFAWLLDGSIAFAAGGGVALAHPEKGIWQVVKAHEGRVTAISVFRLGKPGLQQDLGLFTGGDDGRVRLWTFANDKRTIEPVGDLPPHEDSVYSLAVLPLDSAPGQICALVASGGQDRRVHVTKLVEMACESSQTLELGQLYPLALALGHLPQSSHVLLLVGGSQRTVQVFTSDASDNFSFEKRVELKGHQDWVRGLSVATVQLPSGPLDDPAAAQAAEDARAAAAQFRFGLLNGDVLVASASQDRTVRVWRITPVKQDAEALGDQLDEISAARPVEILCGGGKDRFAVALDSVLSGHDERVLDVHWRPAAVCDLAKAAVVQPLELVSCSADRCMITWAAGRTAGALWESTARLGSASNNTTAGELRGCGWAPNTFSRQLLAYDARGAWSHWRESNDKLWEPAAALSGHGGSVEDAAWDPTGAFLVSVSLDQTARVHAQWDGGPCESWHELARPLVHGYNLNSVASCGAARIVVGADEKVVRLFEAPWPFITATQCLVGGAALAAAVESRSLPDACAVLPALGLSNKGSQSLADEPAGILHLERPPLESDLQRGTLWPETDKLYGHGFEVMAVASSQNVIAATCRAAQQPHAAVRLWDAETHASLDPPLVAHSLTVTRLAFSPDGRYLVSVGRDRQWTLFRQNVDRRTASAHGFEIVAAVASAHARIIWDVAWAPCGSFFVTVSRDKTVKVWRASGASEEDWVCAASLALPAAATAVAVDSDCVAVGLETGAIVFMDHALASVGGLDASQQPLGAVTRLAWQPGTHGTLAATSRDGSVRMFSIQ